MQNRFCHIYLCTYLRIAGSGTEPASFWFTFAQSSYDRDKVSGGLTYFATDDGQPSKSLSALYKIYFNNLQMMFFRDKIKFRHKIARIKIAVN